MKPPANNRPGARASYRIGTRPRSFDHFLDPLSRSEMRTHRVVESLRNEIAQAGTEHSLRIRQVFQNPREIFRLELEVPALNYQRTTLLDRDALEILLETEEVRDLVGAILN